MKVKVVEEKENSFFKRKDLILVVNHGGEATPSKESIVKWVVEKYGVDSEQVKIDYIFTRTGVAESKVKIKILKEKPKVEEKPKEVKNEAQDSKSSESTKQ